jgi:hypothetical protein
MSQLKKKVSKQAASPTETAQAQLCSHLKNLKFGDVREYQEWCLRHGFSSKLCKRGCQYRREFETRRMEWAVGRLQRSNLEKDHKRPNLADLLSGKLKTCNVRLAEMRRGLKKLSKASSAHKALAELLLHLQHDSDFFDSKQVIQAPGSNVPGSYIDALTAMAQHHASWVRPLPDWKRHHYNARRRFASLVRHLFAKYDVPAFFDYVWFRGTSAEALQQQNWFIHVAQGKNIRTADLPITYTKRMAHHFLEAPADYSIEAALRYGQILGLGGDARLAAAIRSTKLCTDFARDSFWITVLRFFIENPMLDTVHVGPIVDYLHDQRFEYKDVFVAPGVIERQPPEQPNLCMKGRTAESLLAQVSRWHRQLNHSKHSNLIWVASGIRSFEWIEGNQSSRNQRRWTIHELLNSQALLAEGRAMRHCVASYAGSCLQRRTSIWTLELQTFSGSERVLTVEVQLGSKTICQARGKYNAPPDAKAREVLRRWAAEAGLRLSGYI